MILYLLIAAVTFEQGLQLKREQKLPEAAQVFAELVRAQPRDAAAAEQWATVLGWLGRFDESIAAWRHALELKPGEPDYAVGLARVQYWKGELQPAREGLEKAVQAAPRDLDALSLLGDVCTAAHDPDCAHSAYERAHALDPANADLARKLARAGPRQLHRLDAGGTLDQYNTARDFEGSFFAQVSAQLAAGFVLSAGYEQLRQFGQVDHRVNLTAYLNATDTLQLSARVAVSPGANTIANWDAGVSAEQRVASFASALLLLRHLDFSDNGVTILGPGVRFLYGSFSLLLSGGPVFSSVFDTQAFGQGRLEWNATDELSFYGGYSRGGEAQHVAGAALLPPGAPTTEIRTTSDAIFGAQWQFAPSFGVRLDYTHEVRQATYTRNRLGSAFNYRF